MTLHEDDDEGPAATINVTVQKMPAPFWRFTITRPNEHEDYHERPTETVVVSTGSGALTDYWPSAVLIAENSLVIEST